MSVSTQTDSLEAIRQAEALATKTATSAVYENGNIVLTLDGSGTVTTNTIVKFTAPCTCQDVTGGLVIDGTTYQVVDTMKNVVTGVGGVWDTGALVSVLIDTSEGVAYIINQSTQSIMNMLKELIGEPDDTGGSTTEGTVMSKENSALDYLEKIYALTSKLGVDENGLYVITPDE